MLPEDAVPSMEHGFAAMALVQGGTIVLSEKGTGRIQLRKTMQLPPASRMREQVVCAASRVCAGTRTL